MDDDLVRERAYLLWEQAGCPDGTGEEFWFAAMASLAMEADPDPAEATAPDAPEAVKRDEPEAAKPGNALRAAGAAVSSRTPAKPSAKSVGRPVGGTDKAPAKPPLAGADQSSRR